ncbi:MAG: polysaccharide deacetylase family protein [Xanthomonadales bacterium]|nr:polysaccharide deacetylase family protein [Xanthomonadales bacterium]
MREALTQLRVLMYHRIAPPELDPWRLCVSPERFSRQLEVLGNQFEIISLSDIFSRDDFHNTVALTFDDGYSDNLTIAKPILEAFSAPATVFVTSGYVNGQREYWWDELEQVFLSPGTLPEVLHFHVGNSELHHEFQSSRSFSEDQANLYKNWKVTWDGTKPPTERHELFFNVWNLLMKTDDSARNRTVDYLFKWSGIKRLIRSTHQPLDIKGLEELTSGGLVQIGSHTVTHPDLTSLPREEKVVELSQSKEELDAQLNIDIETIAYPHGRYDLETLFLTREAGYKVAFGTNNKQQLDFDLRFQLPRRMVLDHDIDQFLMAIQ